MTGFILSIVVGLAVIAALIITIRKRKKMALSIFLFLIAFEAIVFLVAGWAFLVYGAIIKMGSM